MNRATHVVQASRKVQPNITAATAGRRKRSASVTQRGLVTICLFHYVINHGNRRPLQPHQQRRVGDQRYFRPLARRNSFYGSAEGRLRKISIRLLATSVANVELN